MSATRNFAKEAADAITDHLHPVLLAASETGDKSVIFSAYAGALGAWWGSLLADAGPEYADKIAKSLIRKILEIDTRELWN